MARTYIVKSPMEENNSYKQLLLHETGVDWMRKPTVDDVLKEGIYGPKEVNPEERRRFLGTFRERVIVALLKNQVRETAIYPHVEQSMKDNPKAHLLLNGKISYEQLSKYVQVAKKYHIEHTIVTDKEHETEIGLVLAMDHAVDKEDIFVADKNLQQQTKETKTEKPSLFSKFF